MTKEVGYGAERALAQYDHAEPDNRRVYEVLEQLRNAGLEEQQRIAKEFDALNEAAAALTPADEMSLREVGRRTGKGNRWSQARVAPVDLHRNMSQGRLSIASKIDPPSAPEILEKVALRQS